MKDLKLNTIKSREDLPVKVLQFGEGNFLRGFVDWIIDILNEKTNFNGGVYIIQPIEHGMVELVKKQDCLYHVWLNGISGGEEVDDKRLITCVKGAMDPHKDYHLFLELGELPELEFIISNTTEAGIAFDAADSSIDTLPSSFPGKLTALLFSRYRKFNGEPNKGLTIIPCELIDRNGDKLKEVVLRYSQHFGLPEEFSTWIEKHNIFCNTLVDRIVPGFPKENIYDVQKQLDYKDELVVKAEPFHLWVIEAPESVKTAFPTGETSLHVKFVDDLTPYRTRKVRILNGAHTAMVPVAYLAGLKTVREAVEDKQIGDFTRKIIFDEIVPTLDLSPEELYEFAEDVIERFKNPFIHHELITIALNSVSKYKVRVLPSLLEFVNRFNKLPENLLHSLAALIVFYKGEWKGDKIPVKDDAEVISFFRKIWEKNDVHKVVHSTLSNEGFWDTDLTKIDGLEASVRSHVENLLHEEQLPNAKTA